MADLPPGYAGPAGGTTTKGRLPPGYSGPSGGRRTTPGRTTLPAPKGTGLTKKGLAKYQAVAKGIESSHGLGDQFSDIIKSVPSGVANLAVSAGKETVSAPINIVGGIAEGDPERIVSGVPVVGQAYGVGRGFVEGEENTSNPFSSTFGASFRRTAEDVRHPTRFVKAYNDGQIVGKVLEDVANVSIVAGGFAKALNTASRGGYLAAETTAKTAAAFEDGVAAAERAAQQAASRAAAEEANAQALRELADQAKFSSSRASASAAFDKAEAVARQARIDATAAEEGVARATAEAQSARTLAQSRIAKAGQGYKAYRLARTVSNLGGQGAALPAKPFEYAARVLSPAAKKFLESSPWLTDAITKIDEKVGLSQALRDRRMRRMLATQIRDIEGVRAGEAARYAKAMSRIDRLTGGDDAIYQAGLALDDLGRGIADQVTPFEKLGTPEAIDGIKAVLEEYSLALGYEKGALGLAVDVALGRADPVVAARIQQIQQVWDTSIKPVQEKIVTEAEGPGKRRAPTPEQQKRAKYTSSPAEAGAAGTVGLPPGLAERTVAAGARTEAALQGQLADLGAKLDKQLEAAGLDTLPSGAKPTEMLDEIARQVAEARATKRVPGAVRDVQRAARAEGRASVAEGAAARLRRLRDTIPESVSDEAVARLSDAVGALQDAQARLDATPLTLEDPAALGAAREAVKETRARVVEVARAERAAMADLPVDALPFIPSDLSEFHAALQDDLLRGTGQVVDDFEIGRAIDRQKGRLAASDGEERFVAAYKTVYNKLPVVVRNALESLDDAGIRDLYRRRNDAMYAGNLDTLAAEYSGTAGVGVAEGVTGEEAIRNMLADYAHARRLDEFIRRGGKGGWDEGIVDVLEQASRSELGQVIRDPESRAAIVRGEQEARGKGRSWTLDDAAKAVRDARAAGQPPPGVVPLPDAGRLDDALNVLAENASQSERLDAVMRSFGDVEGPEATRFYEAYQRAGEPELTDDVLIAMSEGEPPPWLAAGEEGAALEVPSGEQATAALGGDNADVLAAKTEIAQIAATEGGQPLRPALAREAGLLSATATNAAKAADKAGLEGQAIEAVSTPAAKEGAKRGKKLAKVDETLRKIRRTQKAIDKVPERVEAQIEKLYDDVRNAPVNYRHSIRTARDFTGELRRWRNEMVDAATQNGGYVDPAMLAVFDDVLEQGVKDVRDFFFHVAKPGGGITLTEKLPYPRFIPGGRPLDKTIAAAEGPEARPIRGVLSPEERAARGGPRPRTVNEMRAELGRRVRIHTRNDAARLVSSYWGRRADEILGDTEGLTPAEITAAMRDRPERYVSWDQEAFFQSLDSPKGVVMKEAEAGADFNASVWAHKTLWIPEPIFNAIKSYYGTAGTFERFMRQIDKGRNVWRAAVLALRPAWHVNNIIGNAFMAMVGAGMNPVEYTRRIRQAHALLTLPDAQLDVALPESVVRTGLFKGARTRAAQNPARVAKLEQRVAGIEPETLAALNVAPGEYQVPGAITQRGAGAALLVDNVEEILKNPGRLRRTVEKSYALNGAVDDINRLAVFLSSRAKLSEAEVAQFGTRYPELAGLPRDRLRTEGAVRISLKVAGDFLRMTPVERNIFRRIVPFYGWIRHITQLAFRLPAYSPARTVWVLHLADLYGSPQGQYALANTLPLGGGGLLQLPTLNPFGDVIALPGDSGGGIGADAGFNLSPEIKFAAGLAGLDLNRWGEFNRPPGQPGGYGGPPPPAGMVLNRPGEWPGLIGMQFPQTRLLRALEDQIKYGGQRMHYPLGQVRRTPKNQGREPIPSGSPALGPLLQYLGVPFPRRPNIYEAQDLAQQGR